MIIISITLVISGLFGYLFIFMDVSVLCLITLMMYFEWPKSYKYDKCKSCQSYYYKHGDCEICGDFKDSSSSIGIMHDLQMVQRKRSRRKSTEHHQI